MSVVFVFSARESPTRPQLPTTDIYLTVCASSSSSSLTLALFLSFGSKLFLREDRTALDATQPVRGGKLLARHEPRLFYASGEVLRRREEEEEEEEERKERDVSEHHAVPPEVINPCGKGVERGRFSVQMSRLSKNKLVERVRVVFWRATTSGTTLRYTDPRREAYVTAEIGRVGQSQEVVQGMVVNVTRTRKKKKREMRKWEGEREEEKKEVWDSTSVNGLLRVRKKERRMNGKDLFMEYWLKIQRRKYRTAIAIDIAVKRLVLAVKNSRRLKIRYAELTRTVRFQEDANSSFGESGPMNRSDGMLFTKRRDVT